MPYRVYVMGSIMLGCFPHHLFYCCHKKVDDKEVQTDGKLISFDDDGEFKSFVANIQKASEWSDAVSHVFIASSQ